MPTREVIAVGASAGGIAALRRLVADLPRDLAASVLVVLHLPPRSPSNLPAILAWAGPLRANFARDAEPLVPGRVYVAPPDHHLLVDPGRTRLLAGPRENGHRPAVDALFRSAARSYDARVVAVVLSGNLSDGTNGLARVRASGGVGVVQDPRDAAFPEMPSNALAGAGADHVVPLHEMGALLARLVSEPVEPAVGM